MKHYEANNSSISGKTTICGIIGDPIEHTLSPVMQNAAFQKMNLDFLYLPFRVKPDSLSQALCGMKALNMRGLNVTIPHKKAVISFLDEVDPLAEVIGAVNTIVNIEGGLKGYNTDAEGFIRALAAEGVNPQNKNIVVLGAGGAARAIVFLLADKGANLTILNRHVELAQELADWLMRMFRREIKASNLDTEHLTVALEKASILVNTSSVGMAPHVEDTLVTSELFQPGMVVFDIIYNPLQTRLLKDAAQRGAKVINGLDMLVFQGAASFTLWTGQEAPVDTMREAVKQALEKL